MSTIIYTINNHEGLLEPARLSGLPIFAGGWAEILQISYTAHFAGQYDEFAE